MGSLLWADDTKNIVLIAALKSHGSEGNGIHDSDEGWTPLWNVQVLPTTKPNGGVVAWAGQRKNGARGLATSCGHFYANWKERHFRKTILNAFLWTAHADVPAGGVEADFFSHEFFCIR